MTSAEFKAHRLKLGWTQKDAGEALGLTIAQISAIENGRSRVTKTVENLFRLYRPFDTAGRPTGWMDAETYARHRDIMGYRHGTNSHGQPLWRGEK
jgi:transcriptional regulator with XRE-family HTH domain